MLAPAPNPPAPQKVTVLLVTIKIVLIFLNIMKSYIILTIKKKETKNGFIENH